MKEYILIACTALLLMSAFLAPWLLFDNGENIMESSFFRGQDQIRFNNPHGCNCDGSCLNVGWAPFGAVVDACSDDYYYISFWGQRFHIDGK